MEYERIGQKMTAFKRMFSGVDMTEGTPWKKILLFTIPLLIGNFFQQLYNIADAIFLGRFIGDDALAAVGATIPVIFLILVLSLGVAMGAGVMCSQYFGAKSREDLSYTIGTAITLSAVISLILAVFTPLASYRILVLMQTPPQLIDDAALYMNVMFWGIAGLVYFNMLSGILRGLGEAAAPLLYLAVASLLNILLNYIFIGILGMGVFAAAIGTVIAQAVSSILCLRKLMQMRHVFDMSRRYLRPKKKYVTQMLKLGIPTGAFQALFAVAMMATQPLVNDFGEMFIAVNFIVMRIDGFIIMPAFSFGNALAVFAGQNVGAGKIDRVERGVRQGSKMALCTAIILVALVLTFGRYIAGVFTNTPQAVDMTMRMLWILAAGHLAFSITQVLWGAIRGAGDAMTPMWGALINVTLIRIPMAYLLVFLMGRPEAVMYSLLIAWIANLLMASAAYRIGKWRTKGIV